MPNLYPYNGGQSPLEYYAINGNITNGGLGRTALISQTNLLYGQSYKNPSITGNINDQYSSVHTNALSDTLTPLRGRGTGGFLDIYNQNGGDLVDRTKRIDAYANNRSTWGYDVSNYYTAPVIALGGGQIVF